MIDIHSRLGYTQTMNDEIKAYLRKIARAGGSANTEAQIAARADNLKTAQANRRINDEFASVADRRLRYRLRQARKKVGRE